MEIWGKIKDFDNYSVSSFGNIKNNTTNKQLKLNTRCNGYVEIGLLKEKKRYYFLVHRLVTLQFIPNPENKKTVNHIDKDRSNNRVDNLEWATHKEQISKIDKNWSTGERAVLRLDRNTGELLQRYKSLTSAANWILQNPGIDRRKTSNVRSIGTQISAVCNKTSYSSYGYRWEYIKVKPLDGEIWKDIFGTHKVSNYGRITDRKDRLVKLTISGGYLVVNINRRPHLAHRLVAMAFLSNKDNKPHVNHIDGKKDNNCLYNLEFATALENNIHAIRCGLKGKS